MLVAQAGCLPACRLINICGVTGSIPAAWAQPGAFPSLERLMLGTNALTGTLPPVWPLLRRLRRLELTENRFSGSLPTGWEGFDLSEL